jgi:hypothetical protein
MRRSTRGGPPDADQGSRLGQSPIHEDARPFCRDKTPVSALRRTAVLLHQRNLPCQNCSRCCFSSRRVPQNFRIRMVASQKSFRNFGFITPKTPNKHTSLTNRPAGHEKSRLPDSEKRMIKRKAKREVEEDTSHTLPPPRGHEQPPEDARRGPSGAARLGDAPRAVIRLAPRAPRVRRARRAMG